MNLREFLAPLDLAGDGLARADATKCGLDKWKQASKALIMLRSEKNLLAVTLLLALCFVSCGKKGTSNTVLVKAISSQYEKDYGDKTSSVDVEQVFGTYPNALRSPQDTGTTTKLRARIVHAKNHRTYHYMYEISVADSDGFTAAAQVLDEEFANECVKNLRRIDSAAQQWALENGKPLEASPKEEDLAPYLKDHRFPVCPSGGFYTLMPLRVFCLQGGPGHSL